MSDMTIEKNRSKSSLEAIRRTKAGVMPKLLLILLPSILILVIAVGYISYRNSRQFTDDMFNRLARFQAMTLARSIEYYLDRCRKDLLQISQYPPNSVKYRQFMEKTNLHGEGAYRELAYISQTGDDHIFLVSQNDQTALLTADQISDIRPDPFLLYEQFKYANPSEICISNIIEVEHPFPSQTNPNRKIVSKIIRFGMLYYSEEGKQPGYVILSVDARSLRNMISSELSLFSQTIDHNYSGERYSFFFSKDGWILFQAEPDNKKNAELSTDMIRSEYAGALGKPELSCGFKPASHYSHFWKMIKNIQNDQSEVIDISGLTNVPEKIKNHYLSYAPIHFNAFAGGPPLLYGGIAYVHGNKIIKTADMKQDRSILVITLVVMVIVLMLIYVIEKSVFAPVFKELKRIVIDDEKEPKPGKKIIEYVTQKEDRETEKDRPAERPSSERQQAQEKWASTVSHETSVDDVDPERPLSEMMMSWDLTFKMNHRQERAYPIIQKKGGITCKEYRDLIGGDFSFEKAQYDLQDLVKKGLLKKTGLGTSTKYVPIQYF